MQFYRQAYLAITDFDLYARVFEQSPRRTLIYLLSLAAHVAFILTLYYAWVVLPATAQFLDWATETLPPMRVEDGALIVEADQPLVLQYSGETLWTLILDTTGTYRDTRGLQEPVALLTRERLFVRLAGSDNPPPLAWTDVPNFSLPADLENFGTTLNWIFFPVVYSLSLLWSLFFKALQALLLTPLAISVGSLYGVRLPLRSSYTIALYALTPAVVIDLAVLWTGQAGNYFIVLYFAIALIYTYMAAQRCSMAR